MEQNLGREISILQKPSGECIYPFENKFILEHELQCGSAGYMDCYYVVSYNKENIEIARWWLGQGFGIIWKEIND